MADGRTVSGIQPDDLTLLEACGWLPVTDTPAPADTDAVIHDRAVVLVAGVPTVTWTPRPRTPSETGVRVADTNRQAIYGQVAQALADNTAFLAIASPSAAQNAAQIKALTRQVNKLIRLAVGQLDATG